MLNLSLAHCLKATNKGYFKLADCHLKHDFSLEDLAFLSEYLNMSPLKGIDLSFKVNSTNAPGLLNLARVIAKKDNLEKLNFVIDQVQFKNKYKNNPLLRALSFIDTYKLKKLETLILEACITLFKNKPNLRLLKLDLLPLENAFTKKQASQLTKNLQNSPLAFVDLHMAVEKNAKLPFFTHITNHLVQFKLKGCQLGNDVLQSLQYARNLKEFELNGMDFKLDDLLFLQNILKENPNLQFLYLSNTNLGQLDSSLIIDCFEDCPSLCALELSEDNLSQLNTSSLCNYLSQNPKNLIKLDLTNNAYMPVDAVQIGKALTYNNNLEKLVMDGNYIEDEGLQDIIQLLGINKSLLSISLSHNCRFGPSQQTVDALCALLKDPNCQLIELDFIQNTSATQTDQLIAAIQANTSLKDAHLNLSQFSALGKLHQAMLDLRFSDSEISNKIGLVTPKTSTHLDPTKPIQSSNPLFSLKASKPTYTTLTGHSTPTSAKA